MLYSMLCYAAGVSFDAKNNNGLILLHRDSAALDVGF